MLEINHYLLKILQPKLEELINIDSVIEKVLDDIRLRLISVIRKWNDPDIINTLLFLGYEEAVFYRPKADVKIRSLVVIAIRDSIIEDLASTSESAAKFGLEESPISDSDIIDITRAAINYFSGVQFSDITINLETENIFANLPVRYPVAWEAIKQLSILTVHNKMKVEYSPIRMKDISIKELKMERGYVKEKVEEKNRQIVIQSGMESTLESQTLQILRKVKVEQIPFFSDSFKGISRNLDKLLHIIEFVLRQGLPVVTLNYYIENGMVAKRKKLLKPLHTPNDTVEKLKGSQHKSCIEKHRNVLLGMARSLD